MLDAETEANPWGQGLWPWIWLKAILASRLRSVGRAWGQKVKAEVIRSMLRPMLRGWCQNFVSKPVWPRGVNSSGCMQTISSFFEAHSWVRQSVAARQVNASSMRACLCPTERPWPISWYPAAITEQTGQQSGWRTYHGRQRHTMLNTMVTDTGRRWQRWWAQSSINCSVWETWRFLCWCYRTITSSESVFVHFQPSTVNRPATIHSDTSCSSLITTACMAALLRNIDLDTPHVEFVWLCGVRAWIGSEGCHQTHCALFPLLVNSFL